MSDDYPKPKYMKGVLVYADGRTTAVDTALGAAWWVQANACEPAQPKRYFLLSGLAYSDGKRARRPVLVYAEQPEWAYRERDR